MKEKPEYQFFVSISRLLLYGALALAIFLSVAFFIFMLRGSASEEFPMPDLVGKYYIDVHNDLARMQIRSVIQKKSYPDKPAGLILAQSIDPGAKVSVREKLYIVVNQPEPVLEMPELVGASYENAKAKLASMPADEEVYALQIGSVSFVPAPNVPAGTVIAQYPAAKERVSPFERAYLLVAQSETAKDMKDAGPIPKQGLLDTIPGQNIAIASQFFVTLKKEYRIRSIKSPASFVDSGVVQSAEEKDGVVYLDVLYKKPSERFQNGLEKISVELDEPGVCKGELIRGNETSQFFLTKDRKAAEKTETPLVFYRQGTVQVKVTCGDSVVYKKKFHPEV
jgi:hypothetical protein